MNPNGEDHGFCVLNSNLAAWQTLVGQLSASALESPPILVMGPSGVGKSHMIRAALHSVLPPPEASTATTWCSAADFMERLVAALRMGKREPLFEPGRTVIVEHVEDLEGKHRSLKELFAHLYRVHVAGGHVVLSVKNDRLVPWLGQPYVPKLWETPVVVVVPPPFPSEIRDVISSLEVTEEPPFEGVSHTDLEPAHGLVQELHCARKLATAVEMVAGEDEDEDENEDKNKEVPKHTAQEPAEAQAASLALRPLHGDLEPVLECSSGRLLLLGVGGRGVSFVAWHAAVTDYPSIEHIACDCDRQLLDTVQGVRRHLLPVEDSRKNPSNIRVAAGVAVDDLLEDLPLDTTIILVAGLGGSAGSGAAPTFARLFTNLRFDVKVVLTLPFAFEGSARHSLAESAVSEIDKVGVPVFIQENQVLVEQRPQRPLPLTFREYDLEIASRIVLPADKNPA